MGWMGDGAVAEFCYQVAIDSWVGRTCDPRDVCLTPAEVLVRCQRWYQP